MGFLRTFAKRLFTQPERPMLELGVQAPAFEVSDHHGQTVRSTDFTGKRYVLWFYPKADTPG